MTNEKKLVYTLTTTHLIPTGPKSPLLETMVFFEDKALVDGGFRIKTITPHQKGLTRKENIYSVEISRFRYLPERYEISTSMPDALKSSLGRLKLSFLSTSFLFSTFFHCLKEKPDLILAHWAVPAGIIAYLMMKILKIKYVISVHGGEVAPLKNSKTLRKLVVNVLNNSTKVIVNGGFTENEFIKMGVQKNKLKIIHGPPNYVKHVKDTDLLTEFRDKITNKDKKIILCVTRLIELKGTRYLIEAIPHLKSQNIHCLIVGNGKLLSELQKLVNSLNISEKVTFFGHADKKELGMIYDVSDVFVLPSIIDSTGATDAMPLVIPEAMESKLPVIGTKVGGIPFMISNNENGLTVEPKDSILLAQAIDKVLLDEEFRDRIIANSQELVKTRTLQSTHDKYIEIINESITKE